MQVWIDNMLAQILEQSQPQATVYFLHIRRGDSRKFVAIRLTLERMQELMECSLEGRQGTHVTLLFASDEQDPTYRHGIRSIVNRFANIQMID
jgi:hypothetical protein